MKTISKALELMQFTWENTKVDSWNRLNEAMRKALSLAITAKIAFNRDDFKNIYSLFNGGYWFYVNTNGVGMGEYFYKEAVEQDNISACQSYESFLNFKPFIDKKGRRLCIRSSYYDKNNRYRVTGFNFENKVIHLVKYNISDWEEKGDRNLLRFTNKEWNEFRNQLERF